MPLKWHYPVGLLFDLYAGATPASKTAIGGDESSENDSKIPWRLVVHFSNWPDENLVRLDADGMVMGDAFINSVKEADFLRNGTAKGIMSLSKEDSSGLWKAVEEGEYAIGTQHVPPVFRTGFNIMAQLIFPPSSAYQAFYSLKFRNLFATYQLGSFCHSHLTTSLHRSKLFNRHFLLQYQQRACSPAKC